MFFGKKKELKKTEQKEKKKIEREKKKAAVEFL